MLSIALSLTALSPAPAEDVDFLEDVWPILEARCISCHGPEKQKGKMRLDTHAGMFGEGTKWKPIVAGDLDESIVWELINLPADDPDIMPADDDPLTAAEIEVFKSWIEAGAPWAQPTMKAKAVDPLAVPELSDAQRAARDVALGRLAERGLYALQVSTGHDAVDVNLSLQRGKVGDGELGLLEGLEPALVWLNLSGTAVGDAGMERVASFGQLRRLNLSKTAVGDAGLAKLAGLEHLTYLNLYGTQVTDTGLAHLKGMASLQKVFLWQSAVTAEGAAALAEALPNAQVNTGATMKARPAAAAPVNDKCPVSGADVDASVTSAFGGHVVAFCCNDCKGKFDANPESFSAKLALPAGPINDACPVSGQPVDAAQTVSFEGETVGFCCPKCKAAFEKEPAKFAEKLGLEKTAGPVNDKCPVSDQPVDAAQTVAYEGATVAFCCGKCKAAFEKEPAKFAAKLGLGKTAGPVNEKCPVSGQPVDAAQTVAYEGKTVAFCCGKCKAAFEKEPAKFAGKIGG